MTVDPHKWFFQAYDIGALLVRRRRDLTDTFHRAPEYYRGGGTGRDDEAEDLETRPAQLLPARDGGDATLAGPQAVDELEAPRARPDWPASSRPMWTPRRTSPDGSRRATTSTPLPSEPPLSVVCFRHLPAGRRGADRSGAVDLGALDEHQDRVALALEASGDGWLTTTVLRGRTYLRVGIVNYFTTEDDIDHLLATLRRLAAELV